MASVFASQMFSIIYHDFFLINAWDTLAAKRLDAQHHDQLRPSKSLMLILEIDLGVLTRLAAARVCVVCNA